MHNPTNTAHPGDILMDELNARGLKKMAFARQLKISNSQFSDLIHGKKGMTEIVARKLEQQWGIPYDYWMQLQANHDYFYNTEK